MDSPTTANGLFGVIREFFSNAAVSEAERAAAWAVLTALRGPDSGDFVAKNATTVLIRYQLLGEDNHMWPYVNIASQDSDANTQIRQDMLNDHFEVHARQAFDVLGLSWHTNNRNL